MQHRRYESLAFWARDRKDARPINEALAEAEALVVSGFSAPVLSEMRAPEHTPDYDGDLDTAA